MLSDEGVSSEKTADSYSHFFSVNGFAMNLKKNSLIVYRYGDTSMKLNVNGIKFLGSTLTLNYSFKKHLEIFKSNMKGKISKPFTRHLSWKTREEFGIFQYKDSK